MSKKSVRGLGLFLGLCLTGLVGCGGPAVEAEEPATGSTEQAILYCSIDQPCPANYTCASGCRRICDYNAYPATGCSGTYKCCDGYYEPNGGGYEPYCAPSCPL